MEQKPRPWILVIELRPVLLAEMTFLRSVLGVTRRCNFKTRQSGEPWNLQFQRKDKVIFSESLKDHVLRIGDESKQILFYKAILVMFAGEEEEKNYWNISLVFLCSQNMDLIFGTISILPLQICFIPFSDRFCGLHCCTFSIKSIVINSQNLSLDYTSKSLLISALSVVSITVNSYSSSRVLNLYNIILLSWSSFNTHTYI